MKNYTSSNPEFKTVIKVVETTDPAHADNINASVKQLLQNTMKNREELQIIGEKLKSVTNRIIDSLAAVRANTQKGYAAGALALKEAAGTVMTDTLAAGATTLTFINSAITDDSLIDIYTDVYGIAPSAMAQDGNTLTLTFDAQEETDVKVKVRVM